jgi:hypothetical protein
MPNRCPSTAFTSQPAQSVGQAQSRGSRLSTVSSRQVYSASATAMAASWSRAGMSLTAVTVEFICVSLVV